MKKWFVLALALCISTGSATVDLIEDTTNPIFNELLRSKGVGTCEKGTYEAYVSAKDDGSAYNISPTATRAIFMDIYTRADSELKLVRTIQDTSISYLDILTLKTGGITLARRATYVSGYELVERCSID